jgi:FHA domain
MGLLQHIATKEAITLEPEFLVGRRPVAELHLDQAFVSSQHASIRWTGDVWELRDLSSRNGTLLNGAAIRPGQGMRLKKGDQIAFGSPEQTWELVDDSEPRAMVVPLDARGEPIFAEGDMLPLPSQESPSDTLFRGSDGVWYLEREDAVVMLRPQMIFESTHRRYRFSCPELVTDTSTANFPEFVRGELARLKLLFRVSRDEEYVEISAIRDGRRDELPVRNFNYLLLLLARQRLTDAEAKLSELASGWVDQEQFIESIKSSPERLSIDIFRIRRQFAGIGVADAAKIVERRPSTKQLRIGVADVQIDPI